MRTSRSKVFGELLDQVREEGLDATVAPADRPRRKAVLGARQNDIGAVVSGKNRMVRRIDHPPARIRPWPGHNRDYDRLSPERCADLIEGFKRAGQQFPVIVRALPDDDPGRDDHDYEFVCGARRHWTAAYLQRDLVIEVRELDDRAAFLLQDIENRDREDVSDLERARDYRRALPLFFDNSRSRMAGELEIDPGNFSRLLALADLPSEIIDAYADERELVVHHGTFYLKALKDGAVRKRVIAAARALHDQPVDGKRVIAELRNAAADVGVTKPKPLMKGRAGALAWKRSGQGVCSVTFDAVRTDESHLEQLRTDFEAVLRALSAKAGDGDGSRRSTGRGRPSTSEATLPSTGAGPDPGL